jgi:hypothetical protein
LASNEPEKNSKSRKPIFTWTLLFIKCLNLRNPLDFYDRNSTLFTQFLDPRKGFNPLVLYRKPKSNLKQDVPQDIHPWSRLYKKIKE